jgi:hypothetical protein
MAPKDLAESLGEKRFEHVRNIVQRADFTKCQADPDMKEWYSCMTDSIAFLVTQKNDIVPPQTEFKIGPFDIKGMKSFDMVISVAVLALFLAVGKLILTP